jgi:hypothetical protein
MRRSRSGAKRSRPGLLERGGLASGPCARVTAVLAYLMAIRITWLVQKRDAPNGLREIGHAPAGWAGGDVRRSKFAVAIIRPAVDSNGRSSPVEIRFVLKCGRQGVHGAIAIRRPGDL